MSLGRSWTRRGLGWVAVLLPCAQKPWLRPTRGRRGPPLSFGVRSAEPGGGQVWQAGMPTPLRFPYAAVVRPR